MRIWLDPNKLDTYRLTTAEVIAALRAQNAQVAVGQLGGTPAVPGQQLNATVTAQGRSTASRPPASRCRSPPAPTRSRPRSASTPS
jgi:multidrug efflux pump subunit AcrB